MGRKTDGERVEELQQKAAELDKADALLSQRLDVVEKSLDELYAARRAIDGRAAELERVFVEKVADYRRESESQLAALRLEHEKQLAELRRAHETEIRLLKQQVEELKQEQLRWGARLWQAAAGVVVVVVGAAFTTYLGLREVKSLPSLSPRSAPSGSRG